MVKHIHLQNEALNAGLQQEGGLVLIRFDLLAEGVPPLRQVTELVVGVGYRLLSLFAGAGWKPRLICFGHSAPRDLRTHRRVLGDAVEFGHQFNGIVCNAADLDSPNPGADPVMARYSQRLLEQAPRSRHEMSDRVRQLVAVLLPLGHCTVDTVAQHLGVNRRSVARRLLAEGTPFSKLVHEMRADLAEHYIADGGRSLAEVSALLGFSAPSAFSRWHRAHFGESARGRVAGRTSVPEFRPAVSARSRGRPGSSRADGIT